MGNRKRKIYFRKGESGMEPTQEGVSGYLASHSDGL